jgi:hypothetical protein
VASHLQGRQHRVGGCGPHTLTHTHAHTHTLAHAVNIHTQTDRQPPRSSSPSPCCAWGG